MQQDLYNLSLAQAQADYANTVDPDQETETETINTAQATYDESPGAKQRLADLQ